MEDTIQTASAPSGVYVSGPEERESYWQPVPANGYVSIALAPHLVGMENPFGMGTQSLAPGGYVREHTHEEHEEAVFVIEGHGRTVIAGQEYKLGPDSTVFIPKSTRHMFINDGETPMRWVWLIVPNGLENFFRLIGKPRKPGDRVPSNFPRPENVLEIERQTVFGADLSDKFDPVNQSKR
ncbi:cupin domain-containing protein [Brucella pseudogrignonensis]|uniref:Quercetin dioxygenase-like cupin family protein n=1 Tax=Brucella pseudogrignonensis TaxID=419475 RepID=A0ABU1MDV7_9HYPH|nr:cupin domain-containing protein [Brucella pseudogrignonensis]MDR6434234.1 quercetin dioxygenase-like cupin family protein [Brucella pseudogrignonensis]